MGLALGEQVGINFCSSEVASPLALRTSFSMRNAFLLLDLHKKNDFLNEGGQKNFVFFNSVHNRMWNMKGNYRLRFCFFLFYKTAIQCSNDLTCFAWMAIIPYNSLATVSR